MAKTLNSALSSIYDRFVFTGSTRSEFYYTGGIGGDDTKVTALQLTTLKNVDDEAVLTTDSSQDASFANDVKLLSDASVLNFGAHNDVKLTHVHNTGLLLSQDGSGSIPVLQIREAGLAISSSTSGQLDIDAGTELELGAPTIDINASTACEIDNTNTTNGVKVGVNTDGGKVFIGHTTSETTVNDNLTVTGTVTANSTVVLNDHATVAVNKQLKFGDGAQHIATDNTDLTITTDTDLLISAVKVGIGTTEPEKKLHIAHDSSTIEYPLMVGNPNQTAGARTGILFEVYDQEASIEVERDENNVGVDMRFLLADSSDGTKQERLTILESGNVGIGDAAPPSNLHIKTASGGTTLGFQCATNATDYDIDYYLNSSDDIYSRIRWNEGSTDWSFQTNVTGGLTTPMIVNYNGTGNVGIGMSPDTVFNVKGAASSGIRLYKSDGSTVIAKLEGDGSEDGDLTLNNSSGTTNIYLSGQDSGASYIKTGDFTIGGTSGGYKLNCIDSHETDFVARIYADHTGSATKILELTNKHGGDPTTGNKYITFADLDGTLDSIEGDGAGGIRFTGEAEDTYSDSRIKTDIADLGSALSKINALKPRTFNYSDEFLNQNFQTHTIKEWQKKTQVGFIAQEIGSVFPDIVQTTPHMVQNDNISYDGEIYNTNDWVDIQEVAWGRKGNAHFLAYLVKAIQELSAKVEALENA